MWFVADLVIALENPLKNCIDHQILLEPIGLSTHIFVSFAWRFFIELIDIWKFTHELPINLFAW